MASSRLARRNCTVVLGALPAREETGKARAKQFVGGIDGEPDAVAAIQPAAAHIKRPSV